MTEDFLPPPNEDRFTTPGGPSSAEAGSQAIGWMRFEPDADSGDLVPPAMLTRQTSEQIQKPESHELS